MSTKRFKYLGYLQIFIGMGAVAGGLPMIITPSGSDTGLSTEILQNTPFENYLIPGIILFTINGMGHLIASYFSLKIRYVAGILGIVFGADSGDMDCFSALLFGLFQLVSTTLPCIGNH